MRVSQNAGYSRINVVELSSKFFVMGLNEKIEHLL
jgi:hypothetical protein